MPAASDFKRCRAGGYTENSGRGTQIAITLTIFQWARDIGTSYSEVFRGQYFTA